MYQRKYIDPDKDDEPRTESIFAWQGREFPDGHRYRIESQGKFMPWIILRKENGRFKPVGTASVSRPYHRKGYNRLAEDLGQETVRKWIKRQSLIIRD